ncbi:hypothetical protein [Paenibacillus sp. FSL H8-0259]|uniref:hypothetical protein n=1 Tax=Paenibacillus sp. FSL H8-0259 TaxID=1920423 RepID=UPI0009F9BBAD|nr:hypothetical protein [Paenibacillus sp. FSL H8-0259]
MSINSNIDIVQRKIAPCTGPLVCFTLIGKGDYKIEAVVELYSLKGSEVDLARVKFRIGTSYMVIEGSSIDRVLSDNKCLEQSTCFVSGIHGCPQKFHVCISYVPAVDRQSGKIYVQGLLTDRYGHSPKSVSYLIAEWQGMTNLCITRLCGAPITSSPICGPLRMDIELSKDFVKEANSCPAINVASISFVDIATGLGLVQAYKVGRRQKDPIFLFNQNLEEKYVALFPAGGPFSDSVVKEIRINSLRMTIPSAEVYGSLCIDGYYLAQNKWHCIEPNLLKQWT